MPNTIPDDQQPYGGLSLRLKDCDYRSSPQRSAQYEGNPYGNLQKLYVAQLQKDLIKLGFLVANFGDDDSKRDPDGMFDRHTEWAVREFQIYAKMDNVAKKLSDGSLVRVPNEHQLLFDFEFSPWYFPHIKRRPIDGLVDRRLGKTIKMWLDNDYRCPVIIEAWEMAKAAGGPSFNTVGNSPFASNIWLHTEPSAQVDNLAHKEIRVFARDFSGYYDEATSSHATRPDEESNTDFNLIALGYRLKRGGYDGPICASYWFACDNHDPRHRVKLNTCWEEERITPANLLGKQWNEITSPSQKSTYRVIRAVTESETGGYFDAFNAYDQVIASMGLFHWSIAGISDPTDAAKQLAGELVGYLSYLQNVEPSTYKEVAEDFGIRAEQDWQINGQKLFELGFDNNATTGKLRKYCGYLEQQQVPDGTFRRVEYKKRSLNYFRNWHWVYRYVMAARTNKVFQRRMWDMARIRVRDLWNTVFPWNGNPTSFPWSSSMTIGDVFTSERAIAMLVRWHVISPPGVVIKNKVSSTMVGIVNDALAGKQTDPQTWSLDDRNAFARSLCDKILDVTCPKDPQTNKRTDPKNMLPAYNWNPSANGCGPETELSTDWGSFRFDDADPVLPPLPGVLLATQ